MKHRFNRIMPKYPCPNCKSDLCVDLTFDKRIHVSCPSCGLHELFDGSGGTDMAVMEFACSYDEGKLASESQSPSDSAQGMVRAKDEIDLLIKGHNLDGLTKSVLYSKKDYVAFYKRMSRPDPVFGCDVGKSGIDKRLSDALAESGITRLYEFQHTSIKKILLGKNIIIDAPTASGKTEAFLIPVLHMACTQHAKGPSVLILYPTKALAQDQYPKVKKFASES